MSSAASGRIERRFAALRAEGRAGFVTYISAGDPDFDTSLGIVRGLPAAGADVIELGVPFTDPAADGPAVQAAGLRALKAGMTLKRTLELVRAFRETDAETPIILMGYYNPIHNHGAEQFARDAADAGVDGLITVDLPPEEEDELRIPAEAAGLRVIRLIAPTTPEGRLPHVLRHAGGFIYYVSITGITGTREADAEAVGQAMQRLKAATDLPVAVGFGINTPEQAAAVARVADGAVVGSAIVRRIVANLDPHGRAKPELVEDVLSFVGELARGIRGARSG